MRTVADPAPPPLLPVGRVELDKIKYDYRTFIDFMILTAAALFRKLFTFYCSLYCQS